MADDALEEKSSLEVQIRERVFYVYKTYARRTSFNIGKLTIKTPLGGFDGLMLTERERKRFKPKLNKIIKEHANRTYYLTRDTAKEFETIEDAQDEVWKRIKESKQ